jgi:hypothetical protein
MKGERRDSSATSIPSSNAMALSRSQHTTELTPAEDVRSAPWNERHQDSPYAFSMHHCSRSDEGPEQGNYFVAHEHEWRDFFAYQHHLDTLPA